LERHILRNYVFLHAIENDLPLPIGSQDAGLLDAKVGDDDAESTGAFIDLVDTDDSSDLDIAPDMTHLKVHTEEEYKRRAAEVYSQYAGQYVRRFAWISPSLFSNSLGKLLRKDGLSLLEILKKSPQWNPNKDAKLQALYKLLTQTHPNEKILLFTQFSDTAEYLGRELRNLKVDAVESVTGKVSDPTAYAWRFSPVSNGKAEQIRPEERIRVLIATDVLSEGQNLQDSSIVVNYDLPWAIIRLVQRAGRVDRIGQEARRILCYSFLPAAGVEKIIKLRARVNQRLSENAEVVGTDESFFEGDIDSATMTDLYNEKAGILDGDDDREVDLSSYAYQIWKNATDADPRLLKIVPDLPPVSYSTKSVHRPSTPTSLPIGPEGVLVYLRTAQDNDALAWIDTEGKSVTESQFSILKAAECNAYTTALPRSPKHHELVQQGVEMIVREETSAGGQLGRPSGARYKVYERLKRYATEVAGTLLESQDLLKAIDELYRFPLRPTAADILNRRLKSSISDDELAEVVVSLRADDRLCQVTDDEQTREPQIICSLGLVTQ